MKCFTSLLLIFFSLIIRAQNIPVSYFIEEKTSTSSSIKSQYYSFHSGYFPYLYFNYSYDSLINQQYFLREKNIQKPANFYYKSFYSIKDNDFILHVNPIINFYYHNDSTIGIMENKRGVIISGHLSDKFRFVTGATETQGFYREHVNFYRKKNHVIPGGGRARPFKEKGFDYTNSFGYLMYSLNSNWHFLFGHGKQFIGYGYRSVLLSDAPMEYPMLRIEYHNKLLQYICNYSTFQSATEYDDRTKVFSRKYSSLHYLNFLPHKKIEIGIFENTLFHAMSLKRNRPPEEYYSPGLFSHTLIYGLNHKNNALVGLQTQINPFRAVYLYGQLAIDSYDKNQNKLAWQYGIKIFEPLKIKNLLLLAEFNKSSKGTYSSQYQYSIFSQHNEPLAHILGNDFTESVFYVFYRYRFWFVNIKINQSTYYELEKRLEQTPMSEKSKVFQYKIESGIILHKPSRLTFTVGYHFRNSSVKKQDHYIYLGLITRFFNFYDDF